MLKSGISMKFYQINKEKNYQGQHQICLVHNQKGKKIFIRFYF